MNKIILKKENFDKFIFKAPLAIEQYCDRNNIDSITEEQINNLYLKLKTYHKNYENLAKEKNELVKILKEVFELIGWDNFLQYDNGDIEYNYNIKSKEAE